MKKLVIAALFVSLFAIMSIGAEAGRGKGPVTPGQGNLPCPYNGQGPQDGTGQHYGQGR